MQAHNNSMPYQSSTPSWLRCLPYRHSQRVRWWRHGALCGVTRGMNWCLPQMWSCGWFVYFGHFFSHPLYLVMHWSDCNDKRRTIVRQTVPRHAYRRIARALPPTHSDAHVITPPSYVLEEFRSRIRWTAPKSSPKASGRTSPSSSASACVVARTQGSFITLPRCAAT